ncbi:MAG TPA: hypothetical protein ENI33_04875 [Thermoplasmatales archaeon]|nr:hypothetical protein [Thermoplasmatales archaeon]
MEEYQIIKIKRGKIKVNEKIWKKRDALRIIEELGKENKIIYAIDLDGYRRNSANLDLYKKFGEKIWVDAYPRYVEDVMDLFIIGINRVTLWNMKDEYLEKVKEICDGDIFIGEKDAREAVKKAKRYDFKGIVLDENQNVKADNIEIWKIYLLDGKIRRLG